MPDLLPTFDRDAEVLRELVRRRADLERHARGSLARHLEGVGAILAGWKQPARVRLAGLLHSAYSTEAYGFRLFEREERGRVRELVGEDAERLVFAFCACPRRELLAAAAKIAEGARVSIPARWRGVVVELDARDLAALLVIHAANLAEQVARPRGSPGRWLSTASAFLAAAQRMGLEHVPPVLAGCTNVIAAEEETRLLRAYRELAARPGAPAPETAAVLLLSPVGEPLVLAGLSALAARRGEEAASLGARAIAVFDAWGVAWDKRLRVKRWRAIAALLVRDGGGRDRELEASVRRARDVLEGARGSPARLWAQLDALGALPAPPPAPPVLGAPSPAHESHLPPRFATYVAGFRSNAERPMLPFYPGLSAQPWHDPRAFPIVAELERHAAEIAAEAKAFDPARFQEEAENIGRRGKWGVLFLLEMGRRNEENLARSPTLRGILARHRTITSHAGLMYFSALDPGSRIAPHRGPTNVRVRCHLGLEVPPKCGITVGGVGGRWEEGRCIVFDDSFAHEVWNESDARRIVLILDLWHPDLTEDEIALLAGLHRYGAANGPAAERYWGKNDAALRRARAVGKASETSETGKEARSALPDPVAELDARISAALRAGDLARAGDEAARYAALCRGTRWYPETRIDDPVLPASIPWSPVLTPAKLLHDIDQIEYLQTRGVVGDELTSVTRKYDALLEALRPLGENARVPLVGAARADVGHVYNRIVHVRAAPRVAGALSGDWDPANVESAYLAAKPSVVVVDRFLSTDAIESLRLFCLESTIWSTNRYDHGRLGSFFRDGFNAPLLLQIAEELREAFPRVIGRRHPVTQIWGYKYASSQPSLPPHADFAAVNVNLWITPDEANLDPSGGGLVVYDVGAPRDWDFATYNRNGEKIRALLEARGARATHIPYAYNRAVVFDSDLFHATPALSFRSGYENRRINVTLLFGDRHDH